MSCAIPTDKKYHGERSDDENGKREANFFSKSTLVKRKERGFDICPEGMTRNNVRVSRGCFQDQ